MKACDCTHNELGLLYQWALVKGYPDYAADCVAEMERRSADTIVLESFTEHTQRVVVFHRGIHMTTDYVTTYIPESGAH